jgi:integrase
MGAKLWALAHSRCSISLRLKSFSQPGSGAVITTSHSSVIDVRNPFAADQASNVRRSFRAVLTAASLDPADWTPRELRHSFVSLMSDAGVPIEKIARLVGHTGTATTKTVYRKQIRPVVIGGAEVMDSLFPGRDTDA